MDDETRKNLAEKNVSLRSNIEKSLELKKYKSEIEKNILLKFNEILGEAYSNLMSEDMIAGDFHSELHTQISQSLDVFERNFRAVKSDQPT